MFSQMLRLLRPGAGPREGPSLDRQLAIADAHLKNFDRLYQPSAESKPRTPFDSGIPAEEHAVINTTPRQKVTMAGTLFPLMYHMQLGARMYDGKFVPRRDEATPEFIAEFEALARQLGARDIGYLKVPANAIFKGKGIPCQYAILFSVEMEQEPLDTAPSFDCFMEVARGYKDMAYIARKLSQRLRRNGYAAYPGTALGGLTDYPHLAELAGMGAIGYHGLLISPGEGARLRLNTIYTNITNLPTPEATGRPNEHLWVRDFCAMCQKCVRRCPVEAIFAAPKARGDGGMQSIDHATCREYFARNFGCGVCLAICPFSQTSYDKVKAGFKGNPDAPRFIIPVTSITP